MARPISIHVPRKKRPQNDADRGQYIAGVIDANGDFNKQGQCVICFDVRDTSHAYLIKSWIGYGSLRAVPSKNAVVLVLSGKKALSRLSSMIHNKLRHKDRIQQWNTRILSSYSFLHEPMRQDQPIDWESYWFAGFFCADGYFYLRLLERRKKGPNTDSKEVRLVVKVDQKARALLDLFKAFFGGHVFERKKQKTHWYESTHFDAFYEVLKYFDKYHLQCPHHYHVYRTMRRAYILVQQRVHYLQWSKLVAWHKLLHNGPLSRSKKNSGDIIAAFEKSQESGTEDISE